MARLTTSKATRVGGSVGTIVILLLGVMTVWFLGMRNKWTPVLDMQRRVNRKVFNPRQMRSAGTPGAYAAVIRHTGRTSGQHYETPVVPFPTENGFLIVLPYGTSPDWVKNVLASGTAELVHEGKTFAVGSPEVRQIRPGDVPTGEERALRLFDNTQCLVVQRV